MQSKADYQKWSEAQHDIMDAAGKGRRLFTRMGCSGCHGQKDHSVAPDLAGLYAGYVELSNGKVVRADEAYLREFDPPAEEGRCRRIRADHAELQGRALGRAAALIIDYLKTLSDDGGTP